jgi:HEAT repeat protein
MRRILPVMLLILLSGCGRVQPRMAGDKWARALRDADARVRKKAAFTLGNIGPSDPAALPALLEALNDADSGVRGEAILALVKFGPVARAAVPALAGLSRQDQDARVRYYATQALAKLQREESP